MDYAPCAALPTQVQSAYAWQLRLAYDAMSPIPQETLGGTLHRTRLPRPITLALGSIEPLESLWQRAAEMLVAEHNEQIIAYALLTAQASAPAAVLERLVVMPQARRHGVGARLLQSAARWATTAGYDALTTHCAARNDPMVSFNLRWGLQFAGYSEALYPSGEIALLFQRPL